MRWVFLNTFSHITFSFEGFVGNPDLLQFHILCASSSGHSFKYLPYTRYKTYTGIKNIGNIFFFLGIYNYYITNIYNNLWKIIYHFKSYNQQLQPP